MSDDNEIIDLLSDSEDEIVIAKDATLHKQPNEARTVNYYHHVMLSDTEAKIDHKSNADSPNKSETKLPISEGRNKKIVNPYIRKRKDSGHNQLVTVGTLSINKRTKQSKLAAEGGETKRAELQAGLVFEEDINHIQPNLAPAKTSLKQASLSNTKPSLKSNEKEASSTAAEYAELQTMRLSHNLQPVLFHDSIFTAGNPATIDGVHIINKAKKPNLDLSPTKDDFIIPPPPKCRCRSSKSCVLVYSSKGQNIGRPYYKCQNNSCKYFSWAFTSYMLHWYRFGAHNGHCLVKSGRGFRAEDLVQGKVGDCWFLSALAVVAERDDLIQRLVGPNSYKEADKFGVIDVTLFIDGYWKKIVIDNFLPCFIDREKEKSEKDDVRRAMVQSLADVGMSLSDAAIFSKASTARKGTSNRKLASSRFDPNAIADECRSTLYEIQEFLHHDRFNKDPAYRSTAKNAFASSLDRRVSTEDLAYSKAKHNQLWVQFIEKAYAKMHGCYRAISGGHVAEAFLDLTGAPTAVYNFDHHDFNARKFWGEIVSYRQKRLPMGCGTSSSQEGIVGMHAYSILDVREVKNVGAEFFYDKIAQGTLGNVSGFTDLDGTVRLLKIRNPHGQGEWKGEFSDRSHIWQRLLAHKKNLGNSSSMSPALERTMKNDGTFWMAYDDFLMAFSNVDVVLAFQGNHAKSFSSNFPPKPSNHRCQRAFELSAVGRQPGETQDDDVEVFVMCIQKTRRGATHGRFDRKKSYKACDIGILVGEVENGELEAVDGRFFGLARNGHIRLMLSRRSFEKRLIVMPISFGHPAATDEALSFVVRFVSDAPLLVHELPEPPRMNIATQKFCFGSKVMSLGVAGTSHHRGTHGQKTVIFERKLGGSYLFRIYRVDCLAGGGGTVLFYLAVNDASLALMNQSHHQDAMSFSLEINCKGMSCRTASGIEKHEVISKGKKFEAAWRRFSLEYTSESKSRLLCAIVQSGQNYQVGSIKCKPLSASKLVSADSLLQTTLQIKHKYDSYEHHGIFASTNTPSGSTSYEPSIDNELTLALQRSQHEYQSQNSRKEDNQLITLCDSSDDDISVVDGDIGSAIIASLNTKANDNNNNEDEDMKRAIELSLKSLG